MTIIAASIPVLRALLKAENPSKASGSGMPTSPNTASSQAWRDYEALDKDSDQFSTIKLTTIPAGSRANRFDSEGVDDIYR